MAWFGEDNQSWGAWIWGQDTDADGDGDIDLADYGRETQQEFLGMFASDEDGDGDFFDEELEDLQRELEDAADAGQNTAMAAAVGLNLFSLAAVGAVALAAWKLK